MMMLCSKLVSGQSGIYSQQIQTLTGNTVSLNSYAGKKILIAVCSAQSPDLARLSSLDSLGKKNTTSLQIIVIPVLDMGAAATSVNLKSILIDSMHLALVIAQAADGTKTAGSNQQALMKWLTDKNSNIHFDNDLQNLSQMFVIGENGLLYAELFGPGDLTNGNLTGVLNSKAPNN